MFCQRSRNAREWRSYVALTKIFNGYCEGQDEALATVIKACAKPIGASTKRRANRRCIDAAGAGFSGNETRSSQRGPSRLAFTQQSIRSFGMKRFALAFGFMAAACGLATAEENLTGQQLEGRRFVQQSCGVCHTKPTLQSPLFGPALSKATFSQGDAQPKKQIAEGSPNMPGFRYTFSSEQIDAIVAYLKTQDAPAATAAAK
jgi:mono/diheme cytochrome c family protein